MKSQNEFFKKNELNDFILTEFISKYLPDIIIKILNSHEIIMIEIIKKMTDGTAFPEVWQFWTYGVISVLIIIAFIYAVATLCKLMRHNDTESDNDGNDD